MDIRIGPSLTPYQAPAKPETVEADKVAAPNTAAPADPAAATAQAAESGPPPVERTLKPWNIPMLPRRPLNPYESTPGAGTGADSGADVPENSAPARFPL